MKNIYSIYIPTKDSLNKKLSKNFLTSYSEKMSLNFGGATTLKAIGSFHSMSGLYIQEDIYVVSSFGNKTVKNISFLNSLAKELKEEAKQESVLITINNQAFFV